MINTQAAARQQPKKKSKSGKLGGGENLLKEIQAMIISQDITRKNRAKMAKVGGQHALRFLNDPKLNEHKIIGEKNVQIDHLQEQLATAKSKAQGADKVYS